MKILAAVTAVALTATSAFAVEIVENAVAVPSRSFRLNSAAVDRDTNLPAPVVAPGAVYSNVTTFSGTGVTWGLATAGDLNTYAIADDLTTTLPAAGTVTRFGFNIANFNATPENVLPRIRFFDDNGTSGTPGTLLGGFNFNSVAVPATTVSTLNFNVPLASQFQIPAGAVWALLFYSAGADMTSAELANFGQGLFNPPDVGTSSVNEWDSNNGATGASDFASNNPAGFIYSSGYSNGTRPANFGWEIVANVVPEPMSLGTLAIGGVLLGRRRRA